jgi:hypothetical protein
VSDHFPRNGVDGRDFLSGEQVNHVTADRGHVRRRGSLQDGTSQLGQPDERAARIAGVWLPCHQAAQPMYRARTQRAAGRVVGWQRGWRGCISASRASA